MSGDARDGDGPAEAVRTLADALEPEVSLVRPGPAVGVESASVVGDGEIEYLLDEQKYYKLESAYDQTSSYNYWSYTNETKSAVRIAAGQVRKGWPVRNAPANVAVSDLSKVTVEVSAGASLVAEGDFTVGKIEVDASGDGVGTIDNFKLAPKGTLTVRNCAKSRAPVVLPLAFANVDPSILSNWSLCVNGRNRPAGGITVSDDGKVTIHPTGMLIMVR